MRLTPREQEGLLVAMAGDLARRRLARGLKLNHPEAVALLSSELLEGIRDGRSVADLMDAGTRILSRDQVMEGVPLTELAERLRPFLAAETNDREKTFLAKRGGA